MLANKQLKEILTSFWSKFGSDRRKQGVGYSPADKLEALIEMSRVVIDYGKQQPLEKRRRQFNAAKSKLQPWRRFKNCFVCGNPATARHHIVQLQSGGINSKKNLVSLCDECHAKIHPWLGGPITPHVDCDCMACRPWTT